MLNVLVFNISSHYSDSDPHRWVVFAGPAGPTPSPKEEQEGPLSSLEPGTQMKTVLRFAAHPAAADSLDLAVAELAVSEGPRLA